MSPVLRARNSVPVAGKPGTLENTCPSCGAPVLLTQIGECRYCKAAVTSGKFDWVVSRIEQEEDDSGCRGSGENDGKDLVLQVGGAIVGGLGFIWIAFDQANQAWHAGPIVVRVPTDFPY